VIPDEQSYVAFEHLLTAVRVANLNGFACGLGWALSHPDRFRQLLYSDDMEAVERLATEFADHATDRVVVGIVSGDQDGRPTPEFIDDLGVDL
jgi:hypothetical protein